LTARDYYENYWRKDRRYSDPLSAKRRDLVWELTQGCLPGSARVLEIGCGEGETIADALARGHEALGVDIADAAVDRARELNPGAAFATFSADALPWPIADGTYDLVVALEVIEHLFWPRTLLNGAYSALKPGGMLVLSTPYHGRLKNVAVALLAFERHYNPDGEHVRFATDGWLERALRQAGFAPCAVRHLGRGLWFWANSVVAARKPKGEPAR
jgi:SAM-dependent methyltransferase